MDDCCGIRVDIWGKKEEGIIKNNMVAVDGGWVYKSKLEFYEYSFRLVLMENKCLSFMCFLVWRELRCKRKR